MKYGVVISRRTNEPMNEGYTLEEVLELANECNESEIEIYEATGDLAIGPKILIDLVGHVHELEQTLVVQEQARTEDHAQAGLTINFECKRVQAIAMAHGVMACLVDAKNRFDVESDAYKEYQTLAQQRISQCMVSLIETGMSAEEANQRIIQGH